MLHFFGKWVVMPFVLVLTMVFSWYVLIPWLNQAPYVPPEVIITEADKRGYVVSAWDDAYDEDELVYVVFAVKNLSQQMKIQPIDIYKEALTIRAPSQPLPFMIKCCGRKVAVVELWAKQFVGTNAWQARASTTVEKILKDPSPYLAQYPWLSCVTRYIRSKNRKLAWTDEDAMRREMRLVHKSPLGGEFFCPK